MRSKLALSEQQAIKFLNEYGGRVSVTYEKGEWDKLVKGQIVRIGEYGLCGKVEKITRYEDGSMLVVYEILAYVELTKLITKL